MRKYDEKYLSTKNGRAHNLLCSYRQNDKKYNRGECTLTAEWIVENIFTKSCAHCGESDWHKIGCNRIDDSKPHTPDNVEPCCLSCNDKLAKKQSKQVYQYTLDGKLVGIYQSAKDTSTDGFNSSSVCTCCRGGRLNHGKWESANTHKGYKWSYEPL